MPADGISAAATKGLRQVLLAARGRSLPEEQRTAADAYEAKCKRLANAWRQR
jgi:hypothetical protein